MTPAPLIAFKRDPRIDVLRGLALVMIFIDHIPGNTLSLVTLPWWEGKWHPPGGGTPRSLRSLL